MAVNQTQFAHSLTFAAADENKRLGATLVNKPMGHIRSNAEIMNLTIIHKAITEIIAERAETFQHASVTLELFGESKPVTVYYEIGEDLTIYHVLLQGVDLLPLMQTEAIEELYTWLEEDLKEQQAALQYDMLEPKDGITN